jgi:hypothetical protein
MFWTKIALDDETAIEKLKNLTEIIIEFFKISTILNQTFKNYLLSGWEIRICWLIFGVQIGN